jgi:uncharacterized protein with PIN domain
MTLSVRPHFIPCDAPFSCNECGETFPKDSLLMIYRERVPKMYRMGYEERKLCENCGKLLLESLYNG